MMNVDLPLQIWCFGFLLFGIFATGATVLLVGALRKLGG